MGNLYTIGHTNHTQEFFLELLNAYHIDYLVDVRSIPFSKYTAQFNKEDISKFLEKNNIHYVHMGSYFGARQEDPSLYTNDLFDFEKVRDSKHFNIGLNNIIKGLNSGHNIALMCLEKEPIDCHRAILVARGFELNGIEVNHILPDKSLKSQNALNLELLNWYDNIRGIDRHQISLFETTEISEDELLKQAYRERNKKIGYRR